MRMVQLPDRFQNLPCIRNTKFHSRKVELQQLAAYLYPQETTSSLRTCGLYGVGGGGKSQLALEYAYSNLHQYNAVFWISGETELKLAGFFAAPAFELGLGVIAKLAIAGVTFHWLLIFDNGRKPCSVELILAKGG